MKRNKSSVVVVIAGFLLVCISSPHARTSLSGISSSFSEFYRRWSPLVDETVEALVPDASASVELAAEKLSDVEAELDRLESLVSKVGSDISSLPLEEYIVGTAACFTTSESVNTLEQVRTLRSELQQIEGYLRRINGGLAAIQERLTMTIRIVCEDDDPLTASLGLHRYYWCLALVDEREFNLRDRQDRLWDLLQGEVRSAARRLEQEERRRAEGLRDCPEEDTLLTFERNLENIVSDGLLDVGGIADSVADGGSRDELAGATARLPSLLERWVEQGNSAQSFHALTNQFGATAADLEQAMDIANSHPTNNLPMAEKCRLAQEQVRHCQQNRDFSARYASRSHMHSQNVQLMNLCIQENSSWHRQNC